MMESPYNQEVLIKYNLQFFAEGDGGEKTEEPTAKKKEKAREEGQVAKSNEAATALLLVTIFSVLKIVGPDIIDGMIDYIQTMCGLFSSEEELTIVYATFLFRSGIYKLLSAVWPVLLTAFGVGFLVNFLQVGWHPTTKPLMPKLSNINPLSGFKRLFSMKSVVELIKSLLKMILIFAIVYSEVKDYEKLILVIYSINTLDAYALILDICLSIGIKVGAAFVVIAIIDYSYQRYDLNKKLKMTKQEVKDEHKQAEGNPQIKSKIRQMMRQNAMRRMMQDLPKADVIITNPTHFAVAIFYDAEGVGAPVVLAKGADLVAARIREKAKELDIEIVENRPLARSLFYTVEIGDEIPQELYQAVAEVLAFVYNLKNSGAKGVRA